MQNHGPVHSRHGVDEQGLAGARNVYWNLPPARLYEEAVRRGEAKISADGALICHTGEFSGRSPYDARLRAADWRARLIKLADVYDNTCESLGGIASNCINGPGQPSPQRTLDKLDRSKADRAIALAQSDANRPEIQRAIEALRGLYATA